MAAGRTDPAAVRAKRQAAWQRCLPFCKQTTGRGFKTVHQLGPRALAGNAGMRSKRSIAGSLLSQLGLFDRQPLTISKGSSPVTTQTKDMHGFYEGHDMDPL